MNSVTWCGCLRFNDHTHGVIHLILLVGAGVLVETTATRILAHMGKANPARLLSKPYTFVNGVPAYEWAARFSPMSKEVAWLLAKDSPAWLRVVQTGALGVGTSLPLLFVLMSRPTLSCFESP